MFRTTTDTLIKHLQDELNIECDSLIWLHSGLKGLGQLPGGHETITNAFSSVLSSGALVIPSFSYSWNKGENYDPLLTECSGMGGYAETAWKDSRFKRNLNPNFSVSIVDNTPDKKIENSLILPSSRYSCFGEESSFAKMLDLLSDDIPGYILLFGGAHDDVIFRTTFLHMAEESVGVPYRFIKKFKDPMGSSEAVNQSVRYLTREEFLEVNSYSAPEHLSFPIEAKYKLLGEDLKKEKLIRIVKYGYSESRIVEIKPFYSWLISKINDDPEYLLK